MEHAPDNRQENPAERYGLREGVAVTLTKRYSSGESAVADGANMTGNLEHDVRIGAGIELDSGARTTSIQNISEQDGRIYVQTKTSVYEIAVQPEASNEAIVTEQDLVAALRAYDQKGYGEWDLVNDRVPREDNPYDRVLHDAGFREHDPIVFFAEKERHGVIEDGPSGYVIRDGRGNPWGIAAILNGVGGYIKKSG